jgi:ParB-like chromosome segregation protein Spo0J
MDDQTAMAAAFAENADRKEVSLMDKAMGLLKLRTQFGLEGGKNTKVVADMIKKSPAYVTQHEKLVGLPVNIQKRINSGEFNGEQSFKLAKAYAKDPKEMEKILARHDATNEGIAAASRNASVDESLKTPLTKSGIVDHLESLRGSPLTLYANVQEWLDYMLDRFIPGKGSDNTAANKFIAMFESKGAKVQPPPPPKEDKPKAKAAAKAAAKKK